MDSTGRYIVRYEPSNSDHEYLQTTIEMSISDEATLDDMANFFDSFLKAATYVYDGSLKVVTSDCLDHFIYDDTIAAEDIISLGMYDTEVDKISFGYESGK